MIAYLKKARKILKARGISGLYRQILWKKYLVGWNRSYQEWIKEFDTITDADVIEINRRIAAMKHRPLISVLMPVYNVDEKWLRKAMDSVVEQTYPHWEFCIADDASPKPHVRKVLEEYAAKDDRIKVIFRETNGHISAASNSALELVTGEYTVLLDHDDELTKHALFMVAAAVDADPAIDMIYSDEDLIDERGRRYFPKFKPDWSPDLLSSMNFVTHLSVYRTGILKKIGGFTIGREGSQDYDLALRFSEAVPAENIYHIPHILYHWRAISGSVALASDEKSYAHGRAREALNAHFEKKGINAKTVAGFGELHRTTYSLPDPAAKVSIILIEGGEDNDRIVGNLRKTTDYDNVEVIAAKPVDGKSLFAALNDAARSASGEVLCFLEGSSSSRYDGWLTELSAIAVQDGVGAVSGKIVTPRNRIKYAGFLLGVGNGIGRAHYGFHKFDLGSFMRLHVVQNFSAVSVELMAIRKALFEEVGGFDTENFPDSGADVDLCLRLREQGYRIVWTPWAEISQASVPIPFDQDAVEKLRAMWPDVFESDPYFNRNLSNGAGDFSLAFPPRIGKFDL